ncbi:hypothetical protein K469DRAFT_717480, partial [Zopfia rhizophila CBS 207.26]
MEAQIALALKWMSTKTSYKLTDVAAMRSPTSKSTRQKTNQRLTPAQLKALELYIKRFDDLGVISQEQDVVDKLGLQPEDIWNMD